MIRIEGLIGLCLFFAFGGIGLNVSCGHRTFSTRSSLDHKVEFPELNATLYVRSRIWGMAGGHEETRIDAKPIEAGATCTKDCFIIHASEIYYRKIDTDTIEIYAIAAKVPKIHINAIGPVNVRIVEVDTYEELEERAKALLLTKVEAD